MGGTRKLRPLAAGALCLTLSVLALLLWGKLKLVTGVPRTAYAVPRFKATAGRPAPKSPAESPAR